jgi:hypothetical protein
VRAEGPSPGRATTDGDGLLAAIAGAAAGIERAAADLALAEEPSRLAAVLEAEPERG